MSVESLYGLAAELRTPLLEVALQSELAKDKDSRIIAANALKVFDGFIFSLDAGRDGQLELEPMSLAALTDDVLHSLEPLARLYDIKLQLKSKRVRRPVSLHRKAYDYAAHGLLYSAISSLQNSPGSELIITVGGNDPELRVYGSQLEALSQDLDSMLDSSRLKVRPSPMTDGLQSGLLIADTLFQQIHEGLSFASNQHGNGITTRFAVTTQLSLLERAQ